MCEAQINFDSLVEVAEAWFRAKSFTAEERALAEQIEEARQRDPGIADAAVSVAFSKLAPAGLEWR